MMWFEICWHRWLFFLPLYKLGIMSNAYNKCVFNQSRKINNCIHHALSLTTNHYATIDIMIVSYQIMSKEIFNQIKVSFTVERNKIFKWLYKKHKCNIFAVLFLKKLSRIFMIIISLKNNIYWYTCHPRSLAWIIILTGTINNYEWQWASLYACESRNTYMSMFPNRMLLATSQASSFTVTQVRVTHTCIPQWLIIADWRYSSTLAPAI